METIAQQVELGKEYPKLIEKALEEHHIEYDTEVLTKLAELQ